MHELTPYIPLAALVLFFIIGNGLQTALEKIAGKLDGIDKSLGKIYDCVNDVRCLRGELGDITKALENINTHSAYISNELESISTAVQSVSTAVESVSTELGSIETELGSTNTELETISAELKSVKIHQFLA